uniref:NADH-ubiquinone oxidoreductase chain 4 n=1 Tax=Hypoaspis linteyini TaxID=2695865 RepID=A0A6B9WHB0_9ACAR|nr:NADH dehydrogenase subunit 4 [Hypoaspis linteyini]QHQ98581.1 NADH dehydrogenase subunit 4 [Hypoaspis linteyini]
MFISMILMFFMMMVFKNKFLIMVFLMFFIYMMFLLEMSNMTLFFINSEIYIDLMSMIMILLSVWIMIMVVLSMNNLNSNLFLFLCLNMMFMLIMCFSMINLIWFYIFFEAVLIPIILMIFFWGNQLERLSAGMYMLLYTLMGSLPLLIIFLVSDEKFLLFKFVEFLYLESSSKYVTLFYFMAFLIKLPMYGFHVWLPKAHTEAPVGGSMVLAGVLLKLGGYGIYRMMNLLPNKNLMVLDSYILSLSILGSVFIGMLCLCQIDLKILIAYSSVCHMGMVIGGLMSMNKWGEEGILLMMLSHGLCSSALFCVANFFYERFFTRNMMLLKGLMMIFPSMSFWWFVLSTMNMAAPPSMNFLSEILLMGGLLKWSMFMLILLWLISFLSGFYSLYMYSLTQHGKVVYLFSSSMVSLREYSLMLFHVFPLLLYLLKMEIFML